MNRHLKTTATAVVALVTAGLLATGCSSGSDKKQAAPTASTASTDGALKAARTYQAAVNAQSWRLACELESARLRGGSVDDCVRDNTPTVPSASSSSPPPTDEPAPPVYADGSTPAPAATRTTSGPDRAETGPVSASDLIEVPATDKHPAGYGALVTYTVTWPGKPSTTDRHALRMIREAGAWRVDQQEDVQAGDEGHGSPVRAALGK